MMIVTSMVMMVMTAIIVTHDSNVWKGPLEVPCGNFSIVVMIFCSPHQLQRHIQENLKNCNFSVFLSEIFFVIE